ncbi:histidine phosphatase family protein [Rhodoblastus sp.]|uniref:histidine phosphatase family protein n=1 Tax=Rhodoblastus sp. TaxID=1962975 RepID=UPI0035AEBF63
MRFFPLPLCALGLAIFLPPAAALTEPARIILMRHAEKLNPYALCDLGMQRAQALKSQFLGQGAAQSLFAGGEKPDAFLAITLHPIETITPAAQSWNLPVIAYTVVPGEDEDDAAREADVNQRTQQAAHDVMTDPRYLRKIVVMTWEHVHIAKAKLEKSYPGELVTLRQLLHLDQIAGAPKTWPDTNYDFFWIVDYAPNNPIPTGFRMVRQAFTAPFAQLPANDWDEPEPQHIQAGCIK